MSQFPFPPTKSNNNETPKITKSLKCSSRGLSKNHNSKGSFKNPQITNNRISLTDQRSNHNSTKLWPDLNHKTQTIPLFKRKLISQQ
jgi:hypothetical protein